MTWKVPGGDMRLSFVFRALVVALLAMPVFSGASLIDSEQVGNTRYFLFSIPNKVERFDVDAGAFLDPVPLNFSSTAMAVDTGNIYVSHGREVRRYPLDGGASSFIRNAADTVRDLVVIDNWLLVIDINGNTTVLNRADLSLVSTDSSFYQGTSYVAADTINRIFYRTTGVSPSDIREMEISDAGEIIADRDSPYHGDFPSADFLRLFPSETLIADSTGVVYHTSDLTFAGTLVDDFNDLAVEGTDVIVARDDRLERFDTDFRLQGEYDTAAVPDYVSINGGEIFYFAADSSSVTSYTAMLSDFQQAPPQPAADPDAAVIGVDSIGIDESGGEVFVLDNSHHTVFRWSARTESWLAGFGLAGSPDWMTWSEAHDRLYLGYQDGRITWFDTALNDGVEHYLTALPQTLQGLQAAGDYLFAVDPSGAWSRHYSIDIDGNIVDSEEWRNTGQVYLWNPVTERIYHYRDGSSPNDIEYTELFQVDGQFGVDGDSPYHGDYEMSYPLRLSDDNSYLLTGAGHLYDAATLQQQNSLTHAISDAAWADNSLFTLTNTDGNKLQFWSSIFEKTQEFTISTTGSARILGYGAKLVVVKENQGGASLEVLDPFNLPDSDSDGIYDVGDNCPADQNANQSDMDEDGDGDVCDADADGDFIPNDVESAALMNPMDPSDADQDSDMDGASNLLEYLQGTSISDSDSVPTELTSVFYSFEGDGWRDSNWLEYPGDAGAWFRSGLFAEHGDSSLAISSDMNGAESELHFQAMFPEGTLKLELLKPDAYRQYSRVDVIIDGVTECYVSSSTNGWKACSIDVPAGEHKVVFRYRVTSSYSNSAPVFIDSFLFNAYDNDPDGDGFKDDVDNCPETSNPDQADLDKDGTGDLCDGDMDGDGIDNTVEENYSVLDPTDPNDAQLDPDRDNVSSGDEILIGNSPERADDYPLVELMPFVYLRDHQRVEKVTDGVTGNIHVDVEEWSRAGGQWRVSSELRERTVSVKDAGVFVTRERYRVAPGIMVESAFDPPLLALPATLRVGERITSSSQRVARVDGLEVSDQGVHDEFTLLGQGSESFDGEMVSTVTIRHRREVSRTGQPTRQEETTLVYGEGIGLLHTEDAATGDRMDLLEIVNKKTKTVVRVEEEEQDSVLGSLSVVPLALLLMLGVGRRRSFSGRSFRVSFRRWRH